MFRGELASKQLREDHVLHSSQLGIPVSWGKIFVPDGDLYQLHIAQGERGPETLPTLTLPDLVPQLFDTPSTLTETVASLAGKGVGEVDSLRIGLLQQGRKAYILFCEAAVDETSYYFVIYLSKSAKDSPLAQETQADFHNLKWLATQFEDNLIPEARENYGVVNPISLGELSYDGKQYPFFAMPFFPYGELKVDYVPLFDTDGARPVLLGKPLAFHYNVDYTPEMKSVTQSQIQATLRFIKDCYDGAEEDALLASPHIQNWERQHTDLIRANALIYLLSGRRFPNEHHINAGDWMTLISDEGLKLRLTTIRGGFTEPLSEEEFYQKLVNQLEPSDEFPGSHFKPFVNLDPDQFSIIIGQAEDLIIKK